MVAIIDVRDKFKWTLTHAFAASAKSPKVLEKLFEFLKSMEKEDQLLQGDIHGDSPLHSAIRSTARPEVIQKLLTGCPRLTKQMLESKNFRGKTALECAFEKQHWGAVKVILEHCIKNRALVALTGVGELDPGERYKTLLLKASKRRHVQYFNIFFEVCKECNIDIVPVISKSDKHGLTPWFYVVDCCWSQKKFKKLLDLLVKFKIDINTLYIDSQFKSTMLHELARSNKKAEEELLKQEYGAVEKEDALGFLPDQRRRDMDESTISHELAQRNKKAEEGKEYGAVEKEDALDFLPDQRCREMDETIQQPSPSPQQTHQEKVQKIVPNCNSSHHQARQIQENPLPQQAHPETGSASQMYTQEQSSQQVDGGPQNCSGQDPLPQEGTTPSYSLSLFTLSKNSLDLFPSADKVVESTKEDISDESGSCASYVASENPFPTSVQEHSNSEFNI